MYPDCDPHKLVSINIVSRDGLSETINSKERLEQYEGVNFLHNQPYQKVLRVFGRDREGNIRATITSYHPNGQVRQYLEIENNSASGSYQEWHENGVLKVEATVIGGVADVGPNAETSWLFDGESCAWDDEGRLLAKIEYRRGEIHGQSHYFHTNGALWKSVPFSHNMIHGCFEIYRRDGELLQATNYCNGKKHGSARRYWDCEHVAGEEEFQKGVLHTARYYDKGGTLIAQIDQGAGYRATFSKDELCELQQYRDGIQEGDVKVFGSNGSLYRIYHVHHGVKHGEEIEYYPNHPGQLQKLRPQLSVSWYEGMVQGVVKTWYNNGTLESQREMTANQKNGISTAWYKNGAIMLIEEYANGRLVKGEYYQKGQKYPISEVSEGKGVASIYDAEGNFIQKISYLNGEPQIT